MIKKNFKFRRKNKKRKKIQEKENKTTESAATSTPIRSKRKTNVDKEKQSKEVTIVKQAKKKNQTTAVHRAINEPFGLRVKTSPATMVETKQMVDVGFGAFLNIKMEQSPAKLGHFMVENLDDKNLVLRTGKQDIQLTRDVVLEVLGIPNGGLDIHNIKSVKRANENFKVWKFQSPENIARRKILENIRETDDNGIIFKLNFITLFANCFRKTNTIYKIAGVEDISELDWCSYVLNAVRGSKISGFHMTRQLSYMHYTRGLEDYISRIPSAIETWDFDMVKRRKTKEFEHGGFGHFEADEDQDLQEVVVRENTREQDLMEIRAKMRKICRYETEHLETFWKYLDKHPQDVEILNLKEEYHIIFGKGNNSSSGEEDDNDDNNDDKGDDDGDDNNGDDGDDNNGDDDNNDEGDGNEDEGADDGDNNNSDDGNNNEGCDGIDKKGDDADKNEDVPDADKNEDVADADANNKGNDDELLNIEARENVGGEAMSSETRKNMGDKSMETRVVNTESEVNQ
ncbi:hypothetical protein LXL04_023750 [Taraxacum kok-saghyz]